MADQQVSPQMTLLDGNAVHEKPIDSQEMHEVTGGLFGVFVDRDDNPVSTRSPVHSHAVALPATQCEEEGGIPQTITLTVEPPSTSTERGDGVGRTAAALALPMRHRHQLSPDVVQRASSMASSGSVHPVAGTSTPATGGMEGNPHQPRTRSNGLLQDDEEDTSVALRNAVPEPSGPSPSPGMQALGSSMRSITVGSVGLDAKQRSPKVPDLSAAVLQPIPFHLVPGVHRSDVDDALIMQQLLDRHRKMRMAAAVKNHDMHAGRAVPDGSDDDEDGDGEFSPGLVLSPRQSAAVSPTNGAASSLQRHLFAARRRKLTFVQDDVFLESLDLTALDEHVDWLQPSTYRSQWWTMRFMRGKVERDFLRYEMHHHRFQPLLIFAVTMFLVVLAINAVMWVHSPAEALAVIWNVLLGAIVAVVGVVLVAMRMLDRGGGSGGGASTAGGSEASSTSRRWVRSNALWCARLAEFCAWALQLTSIWGTLSAYALVTAACYHTNVFYVPWIKGCSNTTDGSAVTMAPSYFLPDGERCPEMEYYCERAVYPFVVPAIFTAVILFRPRAILAVPTIASAPAAFAASRHITWNAVLVDSPSVFWSKLVLICAFSIVGIAVKVSLEREQRRRFRAYATLYHQLSQYVRHREALADFLDAKLPPILRSRLLNGNVSLDASQTATCILFDLAEFPTWCTRMMPLAAATSVAQLHDVISARSAAAGVEKIRSCGDMFVGASNLAVESPKHAALCCQLALQIFSDAYEFRSAFAAPLALRCGMHTGSLMGLVLGATYRRYDIFGDAIATASRVLDVTQGNQIVMTNNTAEEAAEFAVTIQRGAEAPPHDPAAVPPPGQKACGEVMSPFTRKTHPLFVLNSLRRLVPTCEAYVALIQESAHHRERACRQKKQWASSVSRIRDDALVEENASTAAVSMGASEALVTPTPMEMRHDTYATTKTQGSNSSNHQRATFEVVESRSPASTSQPHSNRPSEPAAPRATLVPFELPPQPLYDPTELREYVVLHNSSTKMLEKAIRESRMKQHCGPMLKRFALDLHELEFSLCYLRAADRVPYVVALMALAGLYLTMIGVILFEASHFPADVLGLLNVTLSSHRNGTSDVDGGAVVGSALLGTAALVALMTAAAVHWSPNIVSENALTMWLLACANFALAFFGTAASSPGVVGSDATYLFFFSIVTLHFGSWSFSGLVLITVVILGVFLAATNTISGTFLPIWTLPLLFLVSVLNMYFDRNRERRLREMYRDLFLTKAASKAVEGEGLVRRSVLRATIPRPLMPLATDVSNQGRLLTTTLNEAIVAHIRLDSINEDVVTALMRQCERKMAAVQREGAAALPLPGGVVSSPTAVADPLSDSGSADGGGVSLAASLAAIEESSSIIEALLNSLTGTELAIVHVFGDEVTIAGPLEEEDSRVGDADRKHNSADIVEVGDDDPHATDAERTSRKRNLETRVQRAAYDMMLLVAQLYRLQARLQRRAATMASSLGTPTPQREDDQPSSRSRRNNVQQPHFSFSAVCVCDTVINVLANGEYPSYDLLGSGAYFSRVLMQQLPQHGCIATERFVQYYQEEIRAAAAAEGIHVPPTALGFASRPEECSTTKFSAAAAGAGAASSPGPPSPFPPAHNSPAETDGSDDWTATPAPQPRVGEVERWRVRGLGTLWVYPILPGSEC